MRQYLDLLEDIKTNGILRLGERTGTGTRAVFGKTLVLSLERYLLLTTKKIRVESILGELLWMIAGGRNIKKLVDQGIYIWVDWPFQKYLEETGLSDRYPKNSEGWYEKRKIFIQRIKEDDEFAEEFGDLGPVYGSQWRNWNGEGIDQLANVINSIKHNPEGRRHIVTAWNPSVLDQVALPACHMTFQFFVGNEKDLDCLMHQRSVDTFLGLPYNLASYAALTMMVAQVCGLKAGRLIWVGGDVHIYNNHWEQVNEQLSRKPKKLPRLIIDGVIKNIDMFRLNSFELVGYDPHSPIRAPISV